MGQALERRAGNKLRNLIGKLTDNKFTGMLTGVFVTAIIQSSSATTVMVVGFVNSGIMSLRQAIPIILGANVGTTITAWILSLSGITSDNIIVNCLKPAFFTPILAFIGVIFYMFSKRDKRKDTGLILLGFAVLMFGMESMTGAVSCLKDVAEFQQLFVLFTNPLLGLLVGAILTAIIQSSSASVGILQALASTGQVSFGAAIPIIMGQNIGTCVTALISGIGTKINAKRTAIVHLIFNLLGALIFISIYWIFKIVAKPAFLADNISLTGIACIHTAFNIACVILFYPFINLLEKYICLILPDKEEEKEESINLDERLLLTPTVALAQCKVQITSMAKYSFASVREVANAFKTNKSDFDIKSIYKKENKTDKYQDALENYLIRLSTQQISEEDTTTATEYLKIIGDFERIADHSVNLADAYKELQNNKISLSNSAHKELIVILNAVDEVMNLTLSAFEKNDLAIALEVEPIEQVVDYLKDELRNSHIKRLQNDDCNIQAGIIWEDLLTNLERISDHCSNVAKSIRNEILQIKNNHDISTYKRFNDENFQRKYLLYKEKYKINAQV